MADEQAPRPPRRQRRLLVLDSYAMLAYLRGEAAGARVRELLARAAGDELGLAMSWINVGEVLYAVERANGIERAHEVLGRIEQLPVAVHGVDRELAIEAAHWKARFPLAYGDCFALALARRLGAAVVTGDPEFERVAGEVAIEWLPRKGER